jgi:hypothetical protein
MGHNGQLGEVLAKADHEFGLLGSIFDGAASGLALLALGSRVTAPS